MTSATVILSVYNVEKMVRKILDDVIAQSFTDFEFLIIDDGSVDATGQICDSYAEKDSRIRVVHRKNGGAPAARNTGLELSLPDDSQFVSIVDDDDWLHHLFFEAELAANRLHHTKICITRLRQTSDRGITEPDEDYLSALRVVPPEDAFFDGKLVATYLNGLLFDKSLFAELRFPEGRDWEDMAVYPRLMFQVSDVAVINHRWYYYYYNEEGISHSGWNPKKLNGLWARETALDHFLSMERGERKKYEKIVLALVCAYFYFWKVLCRQLRDEQMEKSLKLKYYGILFSKLCSFICKIVLHGIGPVALYKYKKT